MKKSIAILLVVVSLIITCCGCGSNGETKAPEEEFANKLLPYGLKFGMSYDEAKEVCEQFPEIKAANNNDGYASEKFKPDYNDYEKFFDINTSELYEDPEAIVLDPAYYFSFNESKELYEFCVITIIFNSESSAEYLFNAYTEYYEEKIEMEAEIEEYADKLFACWETDDLNMDVTMEIDGDEYLVYTVIHNKEYELDE